MTISVEGRKPPGELVCGAGCVMTRGDCTANADCCGGFCDPQTLVCGFIVE